MWPPTAGLCNIYCPRKGVRSQDTPACVSRAKSKASYMHSQVQICVCPLQTILLSAEKKAPNKIPTLHDVAHALRKPNRMALRLHQVVLGVARDSPTAGFGKTTCPRASGSPGLQGGGLEQCWLLGAKGITTNGAVGRYERGSWPYYWNKKLLETRVQ